MTILMANYSGATTGKSGLWSEGGQLTAASTGNEEALVVGRKQNGVGTGRNG